MTQGIFDHLAAPFPADRISWRVGSTTADKSRGMALAYIDARDVMERLDAVCGPGGWQRRHPHVNGTTTCEIGVKVGDEWIWKSDGAGDTDVEAEKGSLSTAFKRAAVNWGIGRYLYDLTSPWVELEQRGRTSVIKDSEYGKLRNLLDQRTAQVRAEPSAPLPPVKPTTGRKSSAQAKRDGDDAKIKADIAQCDRAGLKDWHTNFDDYTAHLPTSWLDSIHNMLELRLEEIVGEEHIASEAADLDAGFRGAIGGASPGRVAGNSGHVQAA
jgi:hypothetical protein